MEDAIIRMEDSREEAKLRRMATRDEWDLWDLRLFEVGIKLCESAGVFVVCGFEEFGRAFFAHDG